MVTLHSLFNDRLSSYMCLHQCLLLPTADGHWGASRFANMGHVPGHALMTLSLEGMPGGAHAEPWDRHTLHPKPHFKRC